MSRWQNRITQLLPTLGLAGALAFVVAGCSSPRYVVAPLPATPSATVPHTHAIKTVFMIVLENHNWSGIKGSGSAPYLNHTLLPMSSYASQYYNPPHNHPSLPNYLWLEAGTNCFPSTGCIRDDNSPSSHRITSNANLAALMQRTGVSWRAYAENMKPGTCPLTSGHLYTPRHVPFLYFKDVYAHPAYCQAHIRPFTQFAGDLQHDTVARFNFITPNLCDDMHSPCFFPLNLVKQGDTWLSRVIPPIMRSSAYRHGGAIFIVWDEASGGDGPIGMIVLSPDGKGHGYTNRIDYTHSSTVRTIEEIFGLHPMLGNAKTAADLRDLFRTFP